MRLCMGRNCRVSQLKYTAVVMCSDQCDGTYTVPVPIINLQNSQIWATKISSGIKFFRYRFRDFFPVPNFSDTGSETFYRYQIWPIPVPRLFSGTNLFRYYQKNEKFPVPVRHTLIAFLYWWFFWHWKLAVSWKRSWYSSFSRKVNCFRIAPFPKIMKFNENLCWCLGDLQRRLYIRSSREWNSLVKE